MLSCDPRDRGWKTVSHVQIQAALGDAVNSSTQSREGRASTRCGDSAVRARTGKGTQSAERTDVAS